MELPASEVIRQAKAWLDSGENLDQASSYFNKIYNATLDGHDKPTNYIFYLACVNMKQNNNAMAILLFKEAIQLNEDFIEAINNLGFVYKNVGRFDLAKECFEKVITLMDKMGDVIPAKDKADYWTNLGSLYTGNGTPDIALEHFTKASAVSDHNNYNKWNRSLAYLELGDYEKGFADFEFGDRVLKSNARTYGRESLPEWDGTPGQSIVIFGEQGIGDELMFASMLPDVLKDCRVILDVHPRLADLFRLNFPKVPVYGTRKETCALIGWSRYHDIDAKIAMGSLGKFYRKDEADFPKTPYLFANPLLVQKYATLLNEMGNKPKVGISWKGGTVSTGKNERCIPLSALLPIFKLSKEVDFISLQYHPTIGEEVRTFEWASDITLNHWQDTLDDYDETAGLVSNLDLIITVPQSVVHLAGALGTAVWQLTPKKALWQMGPYGQDMPWYGSTKNFWQKDAGDWTPVIENVRMELCNLLQMNIES